MPKRTLLAATLVLAACGDGGSTLAPKPATAEATARLARYADPATWEDLDADRPGRRLRDPRTGIVFRRIPAGEFEMGEPVSPYQYSSPQHTVRLSRDYLLAETELTVAVWRRFVDEYGGDPNVEVPPGDDRLPMPVSFADAGAMAQVLSYRLPTEAEWERACIGGLERAAEPWQQADAMQRFAWFHRNSELQSHPVAGKEPNAFGLHDMLGNLWEWCADGWQPTAYADPERKSPAIDPVVTTKAPLRVIRGGSWYSLWPFSPRTRLSAGVDERTAFFGVRFACDAPPIR
ncbi:MAG: SUMF1/EgtB/PvdO family nonheme iron enzyme [Planctomycetes bacterium]|nr:SUMF1/EgtB/PvdO family nonheme iron enzyme [Planctomycetota bacterium]